MPIAAASSARDAWARRAGTAASTASQFAPEPGAELLVLVGRERRTRRPASELFVDPSPPAGLLILPDVDADKLVRRCRALGVEIEVDGEALRAKNATMPPPAERERTASGARARSKTPMPKK